jgi:hypothetical protein
MSALGSNLGRALAAPVDGTLPVATTSMSNVKRMYN